MRVKLTFLEPVLGTWPSNENIARDFIASKAPDASTIEDEIAALGADAVAEKGKTVFPRTAGQPILYDYQVKGFFKDACGMLARVKSKKSSALKVYKKIIGGLKRKGLDLDAQKLVTQNARLARLARRMQETKEDKRNAETDSQRRRLV